MELLHYITVPKTKKITVTKKLLIETICFCPEQQNTYWKGNHMEKALHWPADCTRVKCPVWPL